MSLTSIVIIVLVVLALLVIVGLIAKSARSGSREDDRTRATEIREQADQKATGLPAAQQGAHQSRADADLANAEAEQARLRADRAEEQATRAERDAAQQEAVHEDQVRAADELDPDVDHTAQDYEPDTSTPGTTGAGTTGAAAGAGAAGAGAAAGAHRGTTGGSDSGVWRDDAAAPGTTHSNLNPETPASDGSYVDEHGNLRNTADSGPGAGTTDGSSRAQAAQAPVSDPSDPAAPAAQPAADPTTGSSDQPTYLGTDEHGNHVFGQPAGTTGSDVESEGTRFGTGEAGATGSTADPTTEPVVNPETGERIDPTTGQPITDDPGGAHRA